MFTRPSLILLLYLSSFSVLHAQQPDPIASVLMTRDQVLARDSTGQTRELRRRLLLFAGDTVITGPDGFIQIRMNDSAIIALGEDTEFTFHQYFLSTDPAMPSRAVMELHRGGFRTIDGLIGSRDGDQYRLITPDTEVRPDGTTYECVIDNDKTVCGVTDGTIRMTNQADSVRLGLGSSWDYAEVSDQDSPHVPLIDRPPAISLINRQSGNDRVGPSPGQTGTLAPATPNSGNSGTLFPDPQPVQVKPYKNP